MFNLLPPLSFLKRTVSPQMGNRPLRGGQTNLIPPPWGAFFVALNSISYL